MSDKTEKDDGRKTGGPTKRFRIDDYNAFIRDILEGRLEVWLWSALTEQPEQIREMADRVEAGLGAGKSGQAAPTESERDSSKNGLLGAVAQEYAARHFFEQGALRCDRKCFEALLLHALFAVDALKRVCMNPAVRPLATEYASRSVVWPWLSSSVTGIEIACKAQLKDIGFASKANVSEKLGVILGNELALESLSVATWLYLLSNCNSDVPEQVSPLMVLLQQPRNVTAKGQEHVGGILGKLLESMHNALTLPWAELCKSAPSERRRAIDRALHLVLPILLGNGSGKAVKTSRKTKKGGASTSPDLSADPELGRESTGTSRGSRERPIARRLSPGNKPRPEFRSARPTLKSAHGPAKSPPGPPLGTTLSSHPSKRLQGSGSRPAKPV